MASARPWMHRCRRHRHWPASITCCAKARANTDCYASAERSAREARILVANARERSMIFGAHFLLYSKEAEADRAFLREVLGFSSVDAGGGWPIFALPPGEIAVHPSGAKSPARTEDGMA